MRIPRDAMFRRFQAYGFLKNLRFFDPFLVLFFRETGLSFLEIGALYSVREIAINLLEIPTGIVADACGRRRAMILSFVAYLFSYLLFYFLRGFPAFAGAMVLFAVGEAFRSGTHKAMILEHLRIRGLENLKVAYYGRTRAASLIGSAVAAVIAAGLVFYAGSYRIVFLASTVPYLLGLALLASYPRRLDGDLEVVTGGWMGRARRRVSATTGEFLRTVRRRGVLSGLLSSAGFDALFRSSKDYLQPILQRQAIAMPILVSLQADKRAALLVGTAYFVIYLVASCACRSAGWLQMRAASPSTAVHRTFLLGMGVLAIAGVASWLKLYGLATLAFLILFFLQNARRPILVGYIADLVDHRTLATSLSVEAQFRTLLVAGAAPLIGWIADRGGMGAALIAAAVGGTVLAGLLRVCTPRNETSSPPGREACP